MLIYTEVVLDSSNLSAVVILFFFKMIDVLTMSSFFLMEVVDAQYSLTWLTFESAVSYSSLTHLSLVSLNVFYNSAKIKLGNISFAMLTLESDQASNCAAKFKALLSGGPQIYTKNATDQGLIVMLGQMGYCTGSN